MKTIDLRSDTVTLPSPEMLDAIRSAPLGDDVFREDPTINQLEEMASVMMGKDAALLVPSGTMANLVSVLTHCGRGDEVILGNKAHTFRYEAGGIAAFGGVHPHTLANQEDGTLQLKDMKEAIRKEDIHFPRTRLICLENTHNVCDGSPLSPKYLDEVSALAKENKLKLHVDGARIFHAAVALDVDVKELTRQVDSVTLCLSKGLAAPVGSLICGTDKFIERARGTRKGLGGGMRQGGIIAAAGIVALNKMVSRLSEDHTHAQTLAKGINEIPGLSINPDQVKTNLVYFRLTSDDLTAEELVEKMADRGIRFFALGPNRFRMVTHYGITREDIKTTLHELHKVLGKS